MEVPRMCFAANNKFPPADFSDARHPGAPEGSHCNLGRMPFIQVDDDLIGQSVALNFYAASINGLMGSNTIEAAQILSVGEHVKEMNTAASKLFTWGVEPSAETVENWVNGGAKDVDGPADRAGQGTRHLTWFLGRIEKALPGTKGFAVGDKLSLADIVLYNALGEHLKKSEVAADFPDWRRFPYGTKEGAIAEKLNNYPKIKASVNAVANHAGIKKWLEMRGVQGF